MILLVADNEQLDSRRISSRCKSSGSGLGRGRRWQLVSLGPQLPFPHSSKVMGDPGGSLRELRPRAGRSHWRCIYERIGDVFVIGAVAPEAQKDKAGFDRAVRAAKTRLAEVEP
jgi:hypothetical protein